MHFEVFFGTLREHYLLLFGAAGGVALVAGFVGSRIGSHFGARRAARRGVKDAAAEISRETQFKEIMQAVDVLSLEVERLSEGHRFIAKLLSERAERDRVSLIPPRELQSEYKTPH